MTHTPEGNLRLKFVNMFILGTFNLRIYIVYNLRHSEVYAPRYHLKPNHEYLSKCNLKMSLSKLIIHKRIL